MRHSAVLAAFAAALISLPAAAQGTGTGTSADASAAHRDSVASSITPATGAYNCVRTVWAGHPGGSFRFEAQGLLTLGADGTYSFERSNRVGRYTVVPATRRIEWSGGYFADQGRLDATFSVDGAPHVEVIFHGRDGDTRWVCAQSATRAPDGSATGSAARP